MDTTPLTSTPAGTPERRLLAVTAAAAGVVLTLTACAGPFADALGGARDTVATYRSVQEARGDDALPDWLPADAADIRVKSRPGGAERIVRMEASLDALPDGCVPVSPEQPLAPRPVDAEPSDYRSVSTLHADWWPVEQEQTATMMCGAWWVGEHDGELYAFTPERRTVPVG